MTALTVPAPPGRPRLVADGITLTRRSLDHWVRNPAPLVAALGFNVLMVLVFAYLFGGALVVPDGGSYRQFLIPGMLAMTMVFGISMTTLAVSTDIQRGITDRFRSMPMSSVAPLLGRAAADMVFAAGTLVVMLAVGLAVGWRSTGTAADVLAAVGLLLLLRLALVWIGIYLGQVMKGQEAVAGVQIIEFPFGFLSSAFVSPQTMPGWLGAIAEWNPLSATVGAIRQLFGNPGWGGDSWVAGHYPLLAVLWPLALTAVFLPLAVRKYRSPAD